MPSLFDFLEDEPNKPSTLRYSATPDQYVDPPNLTGVKELELDWETTGLRWYRGDVPTSAGLCLPDGTTHFLSWGQRGGGNNITEDGAKVYFNAIQGVHITNLNTRFEEHMKRAWTGRGFAAQGCTFSDVSHFAALLDDHREAHSQDALVREFLPDESKVKTVDGFTLDPSKMSTYHGRIVGVRAMGDVRQVHKLKKLLLPRLEAEGLLEVKQLEDEFIPVVVECEQNGTLIDVPLLDQWIIESEREWKALLMQLYRNTGLSINPNSDADMARLFKHEGLVSSEKTPSGKPSYKKMEVLKALSDNVNIGIALKIRQLQSLNSKYFLKYRKNVDSEGRLRYAIHQLRASSDDEDAGDQGTISGRCSSSAFKYPDGVDGVNIQQVMKIAKQIARFGDRFIVRQLHIPAKGKQHIRADAKQIEYRVFASMARNPEVLAAYARDPEMSFHKFMWKEKLLPVRPAFTYDQTKNLNFAVIYAAGLAKMGWMLGYYSETMMKQLQGEKARGTHPLLKPVADIKKVYDQVMPEGAPLLRKATHLAMSHCDEYCNRTAESQRLHRMYPHRGYIQTILGRRMRFPVHYKLHKGLNGAIQGTAADINKRKGIELYNERERLGITLRWTVHDEWDMDGNEGPEAVENVREVLDRQSFPKLKVPILWDVKGGKHWREASED